MRTTDPRLAALSAKIAATPARDQYEFHTKTTPKGEPCDVCGCASARKGATHRGLAAHELRGNRDPKTGGVAFYVVRRIVCFGTDYDDAYVGA